MCQLTRLAPAVDVPGETSQGCVCVGGGGGGGGGEQNP